jgi:hypothetical protein
MKQQNQSQRMPALTSISNNIRMPWDELLQAFAADVPRRMKTIHTALYQDPVAELCDLRTLSLTGPRQCGKTESLLQFILGRDDVKFSTKDIFLPYYKRRLGEKFKNYLPILTLSKDLTLVLDEQDKEAIAGVKFLVLDCISPEEFRTFVDTYSANQHHFDPEFMIIRME